MNGHVIGAIFRRNFVSYFSNPTGYVFICVFVLLSSFYAFWPYEFFISNLANLDQLNRHLPLVMLVFIPAITMSIWAEERRQGTDELLLTIPAADFDVVLGKYLAAVAIFSVALAFSFVSNLVVLHTLGSPDWGLFFATYLGYWLVGLAMLAVGMVASFLTSNLTIAFILGVLFNAPLAFAMKADAIMSGPFALAVKRWSLGGQFSDFGRGVISLVGIVYFLAIIAVMFYVSMILIGRRHWRGGRGGNSLMGHYVLRTVALAVAVGGALLIVSNLPMLALARVDVTSERLSALSPSTVALLRKLDNEQPVRVDAYISQSPPEDYIQTRANLLSTLEEMQAVGGRKIRLHVHDVVPGNDAAIEAEKRHNITSREVESMSRGAMTREPVVLGVAVTYGLDKIRIPFLDKGTPIEYELVQAICSATQQKRKKIGVVQTDVPLFNMVEARGREPAKHPLLVALERQYDVVRVDLTQAVPDDVNALLTVQPSTLGPEQMDHFVAAVRRGVPTAIFEDPAPIMTADAGGRQVLGTGQPRQPQMMMGQFAPPMPKGDINKLWNLLQVRFFDREIVWQDYFTYAKIEDLFKDNRYAFVILRSDMPAAKPFNPQEKIAQGQQEMIFPAPGAVMPKEGASLRLVPLVNTGKSTGTFLVSQIMRGFNQQDRFRDEVSGSEAAFNPFDPASHGRAPEKKQGKLGAEYTLAARITGKPPEGAAAADAAEPKPSASSSPEINVILVTDVDWIAPQLFQMRDHPDREIDWRFNNVPLVLNILDALAGDDRFIEIRNRTPRHRVLETIEERKREFREQAKAMEQSKTNERDNDMKAEQKKLDDRIAELNQRTDISRNTKEQEVAMLTLEGMQRLNVKKEQRDRELDADMKEIEREKLKNIREVQDKYKLWSVALPPIFPLIVAGVVYFQRRAREKEGVSRQRLRA